MVKRSSKWQAASEKQKRAMVDGRWWMVDGNNIPFFEGRVAQMPHTTHDVVSGALA